MKAPLPLVLVLSSLTASVLLGRAALESGLPAAPLSEPAATTAQVLREKGLVVTRADTGQPAAVSLQSAPSTRAAATVSQKERTFSPGEITIGVHRYITILNDDTIAHHAYCHSEGMKYTSGAMAPGNQVNIMFDRPGTYEVRCAVHPQMLLTVKVEARK